MLLCCSPYCSTDYCTYSIPLLFPLLQFLRSSQSPSSTRCSSLLLSALFCPVPSSQSTLFTLFLRKFILFRCFFPLLELLPQFPGPHTPQCGP